MSVSTIQIVIDAQDRASKSIETVRGKLLSLTKTTKTIKRTGSGLSRFSGALDVLAGTDLNPLIGQVTTLALVAEPLADIGTGLASKIKPAIASLAAPLRKEGATVGSVLGSAIAGATTVGFVGALGAAGAAAFFTPQILAHLTGEDASSKLAAAGSKMGPVWMAAFQKSMDSRSDWDKAFGNGLQQAINAGDEALLRGGTQSGVGWAQGILDSFQTQMDKQRSDFTGSAQAINADLATALQNNTGLIDAAMEKVTWAIEHPLELANQKAYIQGALLTAEHARGMASNTAEQNTIIDQQIAYLEGQWLNLTGTAYNRGAATVRAWNNGAASVNLRFPHAPGTVAGSHTGGLPNAGQASGGWMRPGETSWVGERGPEIVTAGRGGMNVTANHNSGGNAPIHVVSVNELRRLLDEGNGRQLALAPSSNYSR